MSGRKKVSELEGVRVLECELDIVRKVKERRERARERNGE